MQSTADHTASPIAHILVCGSGLAAWMTVATLARQVASATRITFVDIGGTAESDLFYGTVTSPSAYAFNLAAGVGEPAVTLDSDTAFSWGTRYDHWAGGKRSWTQCFALPFPVVDGVVFHHYLAAVGIDRLEPYLAGAMAAKRGAFAHPPRDDPAGKPQHPLGRAEYGYQFDPDRYAGVFAAATTAATGRVRRIAGALAAVDVDAGVISALRLHDGTVLNADLYVDCSGPAAAVLSALEPETRSGRRIGIAASDAPAARPGRPVRTVTPTPYGWRSDTPLRGRTRRVTVYDPTQADEAFAAHALAPDRIAETTLHHRRHAWAGNCVAIGHAAYVLEPRTPAPMMLLERDVERLLSLIPNAPGMRVERTEYNRRFQEDHDHAAAFDRALVATDGLPDRPYWHAARDEPPSEKLARKLEMFENRGLLVAYDLEPFHPEDWTILHLGMGRRPARHDRLADRAPSAQVHAFLSTLETSIAQSVATVPDCDVYRAHLEQYLLRNRR
ncbi:tryptophan halogenase [Sphingomonas sp. PvP055]|uniref:tryptophan 7-halogenase n=1 Tax=Sphingomonas sp. PvP055 TaxID=3156391 RepID=UPI0033983F1D